ncbi:hypothetical protein ABKN59_005382 [Abortiporus biennis]
MPRRRFRLRIITSMQNNSTRLSTQGPEALRRQYKPAVYLQPYSISFPQLGQLNELFMQDIVVRQLLLRHPLSPFSPETFTKAPVFIERTPNAPHL